MNLIQSYFQDMDTQNGRYEGIWSVINVNRFIKLRPTQIIECNDL
jgi:hypothetical protein